MTPALTDRSGAHVVATGVRCAVGLSAATAGAAIRAGISRVTEHPSLADSIGDKVLCAREPTLDSAIIGRDRMVLLAERCLGELIDKLVSANAWRSDTSVLLALPEPRPGFSPRDATEVLQSLVSRSIAGSQSLRIELAGEGHAGAISAIRMAVDRISSGRQEMVIVGGVDSYLHPSTIEWLDAERRLARPEIRSGFPPGEAAAFLAVINEATCRRLGLQSFARIRRVGCAQETRDPASDLGLLGEGLAEAVANATSDLVLPHEAITDTYGDINGERARSEDWGFSLMRTASRFRDGTAYVTAVGQCGDVGAATGALGCVLATEAWKFACAQGPRALIWASSWNGLRGAVLLENQAA